MSVDIDCLLKRGVAEIIVEAEIRQMLEAGRPLRLKEGFDPSRPDIHLGHVVGLRKLRQFQELGHQVVLIVGDWTAQIGDPSGQSVMRPMLSAEEVKANAETYMTQFFKVVDREKTEVRWQTEWFADFDLADVVRLTSKFTVAQMMAREDFSGRYNAGKPIAITEFLYPLLQAYDSVMVESDVEFGGIDQKFNCLMGRELQQMMGQNPQQVFFTPLLVGTDGKMKMSKSLNNYIAVDDPPNDMYGKVMSIPDDLIMDYFELVTDVPDEELAELRHQLAGQSVNPMDLKKRLARQIITDFHNGDAARLSEEQFERVVQNRELPEEIPAREVPLMRLYEEHTTLSGLISHHLGLLSSRSEAKRKIAERAVALDGRVIEVDLPIAPVDAPTTSGELAEGFLAVANGSIVKVGKRRFAKIIDADKMP